MQHMNLARLSAWTPTFSSLRLDTALYDMYWKAPWDHVLVYPEFTGA